MFALVSFAIENYHFKEPTNRSHPIPHVRFIFVCISCSNVMRILNVCIGLFEQCWEESSFQTNETENKQQGARRRRALADVAARPLDRARGARGVKGL